jgi:hypothetical protein
MMRGRIAVQELALTAPDAQGAQMLETTLLPEAIEGIETRYYLQREGTQRTAGRRVNKGYVFLFFAGQGKASSYRTTYSVSEAAALGGASQGPVQITAGRTALEYVEIAIDLRESEFAGVRDREDFFVHLSECETYSEGIKSATTVSRTIVPPGIIPRFCMGSVEAVGPDTVAPHAHPMLEQLFFGLPGNACVVTADGREAFFGERSLLHIPVGSHHGVHVGQGRRMHYVWMDFFRKEDDVAYIHAQHKPIKK